ncbi:PAS domain S-box protein, partial [Nitrospirota bacterium]
MNLLRRTSLTVKTLLVTLVVGTLVWFLIDMQQTRELKKTFHSQLLEKLDDLTEWDRVQFHKHLRAHDKAARIIATQKRLIDYMISLEQEGWETNVTHKTTYYRDPPKWYPKASVARAFINARYALILDPMGRVREVYQSKGGLPKSIYSDPNILSTLSHTDSIMTNFEDIPYMISSKVVEGQDGRNIGKIVLITPINSEFLINAEGVHTEGHLLALLTGTPPVIIASSRPDIIPPGTSEESLLKDYVLSGKNFFDYGASDLTARMITMMSTSEVKERTMEFVSRGRRNIAITAVIFILTFMVIMLFIARRINHLAAKVASFSVAALGPRKIKVTKGDQLMMLEDQFGQISNEVLESQVALKLSEKIVSSSNDLLAFIGRDLIFRSVNEAYLRIFNKSREEIIDHSVREVIGDENYINVKDKIEDCLNGNNVRFQSWYNTPSTGRRYWDVSYYPHFESDNTFSGFVVSTRDITERRQAEDEIKESEKKFKAVVMESPIGISVCDSTGQCTMANDAIASIIGAKREDVLKQNIHHIESWKKSGLYQKVLDALDRTSVEVFEGEMITTFGKTIFVICYIIALPSGDLIFMLDNITVRKQTEEALRDAKLKAEEASRFKSEFLANMSHEIRTPMNAVQGLTDLLLETDLTEDQSEQLKMLAFSADTLLALINDILDISKIESGKLELDVSDFSLQYIVRNILNSLSIKSKETGTELTLEIAPNVPDSLTGDPIRLSQVLLNIVNNAIKFTDMGNINVNITLENQTDKEICLLFSVTDTGIGIPEEASRFKSEFLANMS